MKTSKKLTERIDNFLADRLEESKAEDLAVSLLKKHDLVPDGVNPEHIAKGIAKRHGIPMNLVPQVVHGIANSYSMSRPMIKTPEGLETKDPMVRSIISKAVIAGTEFMKDYARVHNSEPPATAGEGSALGNHPSTGIASLHYHHNVDAENVSDAVRNWHEIATNRNKEMHLGRGLHQFGEDMDDHEAKAYFHDVHSGEIPHGSSDYIKDFHQRLVKYNPLNKETWNPVHDPSVEHGSRSAQTFLINRTLKHIAEAKGLNIPFKHDHEHTDKSGTTYRGYTLDTPEKANAGCWGEKYCIATGEGASRMNEHYHGGTYKPSHIITKIGKGDDGKPKETLHAAYLPELLPGEAHEDPEQAVRNSGNNAAIRGKAFSAIHPLLSKLDSRINPVSHHYENET